MEIRFISTLLLVIAGWSTQAQKYVAEKSTVSFYSHAVLEDIKADNAKAVSIFNQTTNDIAFSVPIAEFQFAKPLMKEHFKEKYMETEKYPTSTFQGKISGFDFNAKGIQQTKAAGKLTIHGVTRDVEIPGTIEKQGSKLLMKAKFIVKLEDYNITIPQIVWQNIAEQVEVTVDFVYKPQ